MWFRKSVGGGKGDHRINHVPLPAMFAGEADAGKSLQQILFGTEVQRRGATQRSAAGDLAAANRLARQGNFGNIELVETSSTSLNKLRGRYYRPARPTSNKTVLLLSGSHGPAEQYMEAVASAYAGMGAASLALNYRGFGSSGSSDHRGYAKGGSPTESGLYDDAYWMYRHLVDQRRCQPQNIVVHGFSLGGPIAASTVKTLAKEGTRLGGLVLHSPMPSAPEAANEDGTEELAAFITKHALGVFDLRAKLRTIAQHHRDLRIKIICGTHAHGDQLDPTFAIAGNTTTLVADIQQIFFRFHDLQPSQAAADHENVAAHMAAGAQELARLL